MNIKLRKYMFGKKGKRRLGFTLIELLIAITLFSVGMLSILQIFPINRRYLNQSAQMTQAVFLAQEKIESIRGTAYSDLTIGDYEPKASVGTDGNDPLRIFQRRTVISLVDSNHANTNTDIGLKRIDTTVYWEENNLERSYTLSTYLYNK